jgi:lipopolysaccharide biosynthesis protein
MAKSVHELKDMDAARRDLWSFLELVVPEGGLPTVMPRWKKLEDSSLPIVLAEESLTREPEARAEESISAKILVVIHVYEPDFIGDLFRRFQNTTLLQDLVITTDTPEKALRIKDLHGSTLGAASRLQVEVMPNLGRDVLPFWRVLERYGKGYDYFLKLHLKRSAHWEELGYWDASIEGKDAGSAWNDDCFDALIPSSDAECRSLVRWMTDYRLGSLYPRPHRIVASFGWGSEQNMLIAAKILADLGCDPLSLLRPLFFPAGNMLWGAMASFLPLVPYFVDQALYPGEPLALDGTFLHAVERCYSYLLASAGDAVGFLFPPQIGAHSPGLRGVIVEQMIAARLDEERFTPLTEPLLLHQLYSSPCRECQEGAQLLKRELLALKEVIHSMERSRWGRVKARLRRLVWKY